MTTPSLRRVRILCAAIALDALAACGGGSTAPTPTPPPPSTASDLVVAVTGPSDIVAGGQTATWTVTITNAGPAIANAITISDIVDASSTITSVKCAASATAACPKLIGASMSLTQLAVDASITLTIQSVVTAGTDATIFESTTVTAATDRVTANNTATAEARAHSSTLNVSNVASATTVGAGTTVNFIATVANNGTGDETGVKIANQLTDKIVAGPLTCVATGGATCPAETSFPLAVPLLPSGGALSLTVPVTVPFAARGLITSEVSVKSDNLVGALTAVATTTAVDLRSGTYQMVAGTGQTYTLAVDLDALTYSVAGAGFSRSGALTTTDDATYVISGNSSLRATAAELMVGGFDFGSGTRPFVAARTFATTPAELGTLPFTAFGMATTGGTSTTTIDGFAFDGAATLTDCAAATQIFTVATCPTPLLRSYALGFAGSDITGVDAVSGDTIHFRVAQSLGTLIYLRAETDAVCGCTVFGVGLTDNALPMGGSFLGASSTGAAGSLELTDVSYRAAWTRDDASTYAENAVIAVQGTSAPLDLRGGVRSTDGAFLYVLENDPLVLVVGANNGPAAGTLDVWAPAPPVAAGAASAAGKRPLAP